MEVMPKGDVTLPLIRFVFFRSEGSRICSSCGNVLQSQKSNLNIAAVKCLEEDVVATSS